MIAELKFEWCSNCGAPLWPVKHKTVRRILGCYEGLATINVYWDVVCRRCGRINRIWLLADPIGGPRQKKRSLLAAMPAVEGEGPRLLRYRRRMRHGIEQRGSRTGFPEMDR